MAEYNGHRLALYSHELKYEEPSLRPRNGPVRMTSHGQRYVKNSPLNITATTRPD